MFKRNHPDRDVIFFDTEVLGNVYLFCARSKKTRKTVVLWGDGPGHMEHLGKLLNNPSLTWVSFNGINFDAPVMAAAVGLREHYEIKHIANTIIEQRMSAWQAHRDFGLEKLEFDHIDLIEVAPGVMVSLKQYEARLAMPTMQDMPFDHDAIISDEDRQLVVEYCLNDLDATEALYDKLSEALDLREAMSEEYGINLMSKSDAQMAEAIIVKQLNISRNDKPVIPRTVRYSAPPFIQPEGGVLQDILMRVQAHVFKVNPANGVIEFPEMLNQPIMIGGGVYQMGIGGLHSQHDRAVTYVARPDFVIGDFDVGSYYPNILVNAGLVPRGLGQPFIDLYSGFIKTRLAAKHSGQNVIASSMKIMLNGTFGKLGSCFSKIYSPDLMLAITLTGQFYLLCLIEKLCDIGVTVISANTDGIVLGASPELMVKAEALIMTYGWLTNFEFERTDYRVYAAKDVNNYVAVKTNGDVKAKGLYAPSGLQKNPTNEVCSKAVCEYLATGLLVEDFIRAHAKDVANFKDFTQSRNVKGGAVQYEAYVVVDDWIEVCPGQWKRPTWPSTKATVKRKSRPQPISVGVNPTKLGRVVRWYYSTDKSLEINYATTGNRVPKSEAGRPAMTLPKSVPADLDVEAYIDEAKSILANIGVHYA